MIYVGTAGWNVPKLHKAEFPEEGSHLERYSRQLNCVEINSSFYRPHKPSTYARWASSVPSVFRFAVKIPREITHTRKLVGATDVLDQFLPEVGGLGAELGPLVVQLPPCLRYDDHVVRAFLKELRARRRGSDPLGFRTVVVEDGVCSSSDDGHDSIVALFRDRFRFHVETARAAEVMENWRPS